MSQTLGITHSADLLRGASLARRGAAPQRRLSARAVPKRMMHSPTVYPGEDAPGTGTLTGTTHASCLSLHVWYATYVS